MIRILSVAAATAFLAGSAFAQTAAQPQTQQKPLFPWQRPAATQQAPAAQPAQPATTARPTMMPNRGAAANLQAPGRAGENARMKQCGAEWRANKAALSAQYAKWPQYWSACNTRIKTTGR